MIPISPHEHGCVIPVKAQPGARRNAITGEFNGQLKVAVTAAPEKGKANKAIATLLAKTFGLAKGDIELIAGHTSAEKKFLLIGANAADASAFVEELLKEC
jgi:hypothetical protein